LHCGGVEVVEETSSVVGGVARKKEKFIKYHET
jgi:hypothetical protein